MAKYKVNVIRKGTIIVDGVDSLEDADGGVRVWDKDCPDSCNELFFGKEDSYIYERVTDNTYIQVVV